MGVSDHVTPLSAVKAALARTVPEGAAALLAASGGPDSTALMYLVAEARPDLRLSAGHVRHGLRDDAVDAQIAAGHATALGCAYLERRVTVDSRAPAGLEAAARDARYEALAEMAASVDASYLLVGHTSDDQAETVLLNIARGSGLPGLAGMREARALGAGLTVVRPLLGLERDAVRAICAERGLRVACDPTNADVTRRRARGRHETLPALAQLTGHPEGTAGLVRALNRLAAHARDDADALDQLAGVEAARLVVAWGKARVVSIRALHELPRALGSRVVRRMLADIRADGKGTQGLDAESVHRVLALRSGEALHVTGGTWVTAGGGWLGAVPAGCGDLRERPLAVPGRTPIPELGAVVITGTAAEGAPDPLCPPGMRAGACGTVPAVAGLVVRSWRPGDRLTGRSSTGVLASVPRALRGLIPVVAREGEVCWVAGLGQSHGAGGGVPVSLVRAGA
ncbi:MAG: tRNA lysidine(34) synthetase TilS [Egibacteraceae bacterium]